MVPRNDEDVRKLHNEVNQYINQRFTVTMTAITISGVALGWIIQQAFSKPATTTPAVCDDPRCSLLSRRCSYHRLNGFLFLITMVIRRAIAVISTYLRVTNKSTWELDIARFSENPREDGGGGKRRLTSSFFVVLGFMAGLLPLALTMYSCQNPCRQSRFAGPAVSWLS